MALVDRGGARITIDESDKRLHIVMRAQPGWGVWATIAWNVLAVLSFSAVLISALFMKRDFRHVTGKGSAEEAFLLLLITTVVGIACLWTSLWDLVGWEEIQADGLILKIRRGIGRLSLGRTREFNLAQVCEPRFDPLKITRWDRWWRGLLELPDGSVAFDYGVRTFRIGNRLLDEVEARRIVHAIERQRKIRE